MHNRSKRPYHNTRAALEENWHSRSDFRLRNGVNRCTGHKSARCDGQDHWTAGRTIRKALLERPPRLRRRKLSGIAFWQKFLSEAHLDAGQSTVEELNRLDARMWTTQNPAMVAWQNRLKQRGLLTAILSNMGDSVLASVEQEFAWIKGFDVLVWSYQLHWPSLIRRFIFTRCKARHPTRRDSLYR